ncbi:MAG: uL22m family ribosomal protein [Candidatus Shikimatogenerans sp. Tder]|uniref:50S ribosomal protein L22 n=1 Tax=Candidatus Shikimatogenerans sp. Tder TaxID=3158566 RepID=A0AAU7QRH2_9FLAO
MGKRKRLSKFKKNSINNSNIITRVFLRKIRISPRKIRILNILIKNKNIITVLNLLKFNNKKISKILIKTILSCLSYKNDIKKINYKNIYINSFQVNQGGEYKRLNPVSRGKSNIIRKKISNLKLSLVYKNYES